MATIRIIKGRSYYHFRFKGVRCTEKAGLEATKENRQKGREVCQVHRRRNCQWYLSSTRSIFPMGPRSSSLPPRGKTNRSIDISPIGWRGRSSRRRPGATGRVPSGSTSTHSSKTGCFPPLPGRIFAGSKEPWWTRAWSPALSTTSP